MASRVTVGLKKKCCFGWAMKPKTVASGQVSTRVCRRGNASIAAIQLESKEALRRAKTQKVRKRTFAHRLAIEWRHAGPFFRTRRGGWFGTRSHLQAVRPFRIGTPR